MKQISVFIILLSFMTTYSWAGNKAAVVKLIRGEAVLVDGNNKKKLKLNDWVDSGATIRTSAKSFVKLVFTDRSQMNISALSEIKIERFHDKDAGVIGLVKGKIRSQVSKDYLQIDGKDRSKLFIKTSNAVMGIRGTDFLISTTGKNTAAILFEGSVVLNRLSDKRIMDSAKLDDIVDRGVRMFPGEFSVVGVDGAPTIPALLNVQQKAKLEGTKSHRSIVPGGLSGSVVASKPSINLPESDEKAKRASLNPDGYVKDGMVKPANGSIVLIDSALIIQPKSDATLDSSTNTYISQSQEIDLNGNIISNTSSKTDTASLISTPIQAPTDSQFIQIGDSLNDAISAESVVSPTSPTGSTDSTGSTATGPTNGSEDSTVDYTSGAVKETVGGIDRFLNR